MYLVKHHLMYLLPVHQERGKMYAMYPGQILLMMSYCLQFYIYMLNISHRIDGLQVGMVNGVIALFGGQMRTFAGA